MLASRRFSARRVLLSSFFAPLALVLSCAFVPVLQAQLSTTATIGGNITDATGAIVPKATVTVENQGTKTSTVIQSNGDGNFIAPGLPVGTYSVCIATPGFQTYSVTGVVLHPATTATVDGILQAGATSTSVTVEANAVQVETATIENAASVDAAQVSTLPLNGRNYQASGNADARRAEHLRRRPP